MPSIFHSRTCSVFTAALFVHVSAQAEVRAATCTGLVASLKRIERCHRPVLMRHLCTGIAPADFKQIILTHCQLVREGERACMVKRHVAQGVSLDLAQEGVEELLQEGIAWHVDVYRARHDGTLKMPAFQCPQPKPRG
jgi:hypothetical protein